jgi:hypothetical protein
MLGSRGDEFRTAQIAQTALVIALRQDERYVDAAADTAYDYRASDRKHRWAQLP